MLKVRTFLWALRLTILMMLLFSNSSQAQLSTTASAAQSNAPTGAGLMVTDTIVSSALNALNTQVEKIAQSIINTAVTTSSGLNSESDKIAGGLAVLVVVMTFVEFAGSHHPASAWVKVFQNLMVIGIFSAVYVGYTTAAPGFYGWFVTLAQDINNNQSSIQAIGGAGNAVIVGIAHSFDGASAWGVVSDFPKMLMIVVTDILAILCFLVILAAGVVFLYYSLIGVVQSGIGIVFGKIAIALGFHPMTRGFFSSWLSFMIHAGMYTAVSAAMNQLIIKTMLNTLISNTPASGSLNFSTSFASVFSLTMISLFILILSAEIPKIAGMFGSGASGGPAFIRQIAGGAVRGAFD